MATRKKAPDRTTPPVQSKTAIKVLRAGASWHGGNHIWSLPTQATDGAWTPGKWTPPVKPVWCQEGYHLTAEPTRWWGDGSDVVAYLAEYDGAEARSDGEEKFAVERCRLLRPLTDAELAAAGVYLTGHHETIAAAGVKWIGGSATVRYVGGSATVERVGGSATVERVGDSATVGYVGDSATVERVGDSATVERVGVSATVHAYDQAVVVVRYGRPTVTTRALASVLDYRSGRPVHRLADAGMVLTIAPNGGVTQKSEKE